MTSDPGELERLRREVEELRARVEGEHAECEARARQELLSIVSHDLRNPLGSILTGVGLLRKLELPPDRAEKRTKYVDIIQRSAERMNRWVADLLDLAAIETGKLAIQRAPHDAAAIVAETVEKLGPAAADKQIALESRVASTAEVDVDRQRILQVLAGLVGNAIKFTPAGGRVVVTVDGHEPFPTFSVTDTGPGVAQEQRARLFDDYWQLRRQKGAAAGLGLAIARGLVEAHGGRLWLDEGEGGATFRFTVPAAASLAAAR